MTFRERPAQDWYQAFYQELLPAIQSPEETAVITFSLLEHYLSYTKVKHIFNVSLEADEQTEEALNAACKRLLAHEPIQYVLGVTEFCGLSFQVNKHVLIPRPETESLVNFIKEDQAQSNLPAPRILDLCTGSGCIAIALAHHNPEARVEALDNSADAIAVAEENAKRLGVKVKFLKRDLLKKVLPSRSWDIIVSNPPYVLAREKEQMHPRVLAYEPAQALFVPDEKPLLFYKRIAKLAPSHLTPGGRLYVEINEAFGEQVSALFAKAGLENIAVHKDIHEKDRWVVARKASKKPPKN